MAVVILTLVAPAVKGLDEFSMLVLGFEGLDLDVTVVVSLGLAFGLVFFTWPIEVPVNTIIPKNNVKILRMFMDCLIK
jgi:hypothetical protein